MSSKFTTLTMLAATWVVVAAVPDWRSARRRRGCDSNRWTRTATASSRDRMARKRSGVSQIRTGTATDSSPATRSASARSATRTGKRPTTCRIGTSGMSAGPQAGFNNLDHNRDRRISGERMALRYRDVPARRPQSRRRARPDRISRRRRRRCARRELRRSRLEQQRTRRAVGMVWQRLGVHEPRSQPRRRAEPLRSRRRREHAERHVGSVRIAGLQPQRIDQPRRVALVGRVVQSARHESRRHALAAGVRGSGGAPAPGAVGTSGVQSSSGRCASIVSSVGPTRASSCVPAIR